MGYINVPQSAGATVNGTGGDDTFVNDPNGWWGITGKHNLVGGAGNDTYYVSDTATTITEAPDGGNDVIVASNNYVMPANVETMYLDSNARAGFGNDGVNTILGSSGNDLIDGGKGNDQLYGRGGSDVFQFSTASGHDKINDWNSSDILRLSAYSQFKSISDVKAAMTQMGSDVVLKMDANDDIVIANAKVTDFTAANVQLPFSWSGPMHLSFDDEFNQFSANIGAGTKGKTWDVEFGASQGYDALGDRTLGGNGEREIYVDPAFKGQGSTALGLNPFSLNNGVLSIKAAPTPAADKAAAYGYDYTSGYLNTKDSFSQTYGYFEARMKLPTGQGSWPAFWLFRKDQVWPPELDIMEAWNDSTAVQTLHTAQTGTHTQTSSSTWVPDGGDAFHTYGFMWTATTLTWYLDGVAVFSQPTPSDMHSPMYMVLNNAVSGQVTDPNFTSSLDVDYVRAYALGDLPAGTTLVDPDKVATAAANTVSSHGYWGAVAGEDDGFNANYYLAHNPDVAAAGVDPLTHYLQHGKAEGRLPYDLTVATSAATSDVAGLNADGSLALASLPGQVTAATPTPTPTPSPTPTPTASHGYWGEKLDNPDGFNAAYYLAKNPDVAAAGVDPLRHYETYGKKEGRLPFDPTAVQDASHAYWGADSTKPDGFNAAYYLAHNPDVLLAGVDPLTHYETYGKKERRLPFDAGATTPTPTPTPTPTHAYWGADADKPDGFNAAYYLSHNPDVAAAHIDPLQHYETYGKKEGRLPYDPTVTAVTNHSYYGADATQPDNFNALYYLDHNADAAASGLDPLTHYETIGKAQGRLAFDPSMATDYGKQSGVTDGFNAAYYALHNPDVMAAGVNLLNHYEQFGKKEGRLAYDDGSGKGTITGTTGADAFVETTAGGVHTYTGGGGADTFTFKAATGWDTITDFDVAHDKLDVSALTAKYGAPTISAIPWEEGSMVHFSSGETVLLLGVSAADAHHAVFG